MADDQGSGNGQEPPDTHAHGRPPDGWPCGGRPPSGGPTRDDRTSEARTGEAETEGGPELEECGFVVVRDPQHCMRSWRAARRDADRIRAALDDAGLGALFGTVRADVDAGGDPVIVLGGVAGPGDVQRLLDLLGAPGRARRVDGAA